MRARSIAEAFALGAAVCAGAAALAPIVFSNHPWPTAARDALDAQGYGETGAENLVSALYLGYRAYDTIGETVVLLAALAGAMAIISAKQDTEPPAETQPRRGAATRTELLDAVSGKLAPIVLLFGAYVMLNGHLSPGGGFQGGVILASGIAFIAIGRREGGLGAIAPRRRAFDPATLGAVEAVAFAVLIALAVAGAFGGGGITGNPIGSDGSLPRVTYIVGMNIAIGLKVGSGIALLCILLLRTADR
jgi:multicomponent Na+:H+ antiporter subunit B